MYKLSYLGLSLLNEQFIIYFLQSDSFLFTFKLSNETSRINESIWAVGWLLSTNTIVNAKVTLFALKTCIGVSIVSNQC